MVLSKDFILINVFMDFPYFAYYASSMMFYSAIFVYTKYFVFSRYIDEVSTLFIGVFMGIIMLITTNYLNQCWHSALLDLEQLITYLCHGYLSLLGSYLKNTVLWFHSMNIQ